MPGRDDVDAILKQVHTDVEDATNAFDAGMAEEGQAALAELRKHLGEVEKRTNGTRPAPQPTGAQPVMPQNPEAEESVIGACLLNANAYAACVKEGLVPDDFYRGSLGIVFRAVGQLLDKNMTVDAITVAAHLEQQPPPASERKAKSMLDLAGGKARLHELAAIVPASANVWHYARIVRRCALERRLMLAVATVPIDTERISDAAGELTRAEISSDPRRAMDASDWLHVQPEGCPAVWGRGDTVLWAEGEPLMIYGPDGVGKTSLAQQVVLHVCGIRNDVLLGLPVTRAERPVLYLACDRPKQARRSLYRMIPRENHEDLRGRLLIWEGPLPFSIPLQTRALLEFAQLHEAGYVVIDSLKDVAVELTKPEIALKVNQAFQWLSANGVELLILHHPRKDPAGTPSRAKTLEDVYGDRNFVAGMGSVISLWGKAGDPVVTLEHLKQPANEVGPFNILHDHDLGVSRPYEQTSIGEILVEEGKPLLLTEIAVRFYGRPEPTKADLEKARREVRRLVAAGSALELKDSETGALAFAAT